MAKIVCYSFAMADNTKQLAHEFTQLVLDAIKLEEKSATRPRHQVLVAFQVKMPVTLRNRLRRACKDKGIEQTQLTLHAMQQLVAVLLQDKEPGLTQLSLLD